MWSYEQMHMAVWKSEYIDDRASLFSTVKRLRRKLRDADVDLCIDAVRGRGSGSISPSRSLHGQPIMHIMSFTAGIHASRDRVRNSACPVSPKVT